MSAPWAGLGVALPSVDAYGIGHPIAAVAREAERVGLDHVWLPDHLIFHRPILEAITGLAYVAGATERIRLGTAVLNPVLRSPTWLAKQLGTLLTLAPDRLLLGLGLGGEFEAEFRAAGVARGQRGRRLDEFLAQLPRLLAGEAVHDGGLAGTDCPGLAPSVPAPPVLIGGRSQSAIRRAARVGDAYMPMWIDPDRVADVRAELSELAAANGRPVPGLALVAFVNVCEDREQGRAQAAELTRRQYGIEFERVERWTPIGDEHEVAAWLQRYRDAGVDGFSLAIASPDQLGQVQRLAAVRALLRAS